jgi:hypothetical protein
MAEPAKPATAIANTGRMSFSLFPFCVSLTLIALNNIAESLAGRIKAAWSNLITARLPNGGWEGGVGMAMRMILAIVFAGAGAVCWLWPGAIGGLLFHALPVSARESAIIGALFFAGAAILLFIRPSDDKGPWEKRFNGTDPMRRPLETIDRCFAQRVLSSLKSAILSLCMRSRCC